MVQASVGYQCPECVKSANQGVRQARNIAGVRLRPPGMPVVTYTLIGLNVLMFGLQQIVNKPVVGTLGNTPYLFSPFDLRLGLLAKSWAEGQPIGVANGEWYRLVTSMFVHASVMHIAMNMVSLFFIGPMLEMLIGRLRFALVYFVGGIAGGAASYFFMTEVSGPSVGASGAISAVFGCLIVIGLRRKILNVNSIIVVLVLNVFLTVQNSGIDWHDHAGGIAAGALMGATFAYGPEVVKLLGRTSDTAAQKLKLLSTVQFAAMALVLIAAAGSTALHTSDLNDPASRTRSADNSQTLGTSGPNGQLEPTAHDLQAKL